MLPYLFMRYVQKIISYLQSALVQRNWNIRGLPLIPKSMWPAAPGNRSMFNTFVLWIHQLHLPDMQQIVDVGANHGDFSQAACALFPNAKALLVEPLPTLHAELERRCAEKGHSWTLAKCALSRECGSATLHVDAAHDDIGSLAAFSEDYLRANPASKESREFVCEVRTLDDLCAGQGITKIDLLKIDVEGFEFEVLEGAGKTLRTTEAVVVEVSLVRRPNDSDALERMLKLLSDAGFGVVQLLPSLYSQEKPWLPVEFNLLARRQRE